MRRKRVVSLWLDDDIVEILDSLAKEYGSRSRALRRLLKELSLL